MPTFKCTKREIQDIVSAILAKNIQLTPPKDKEDADQYKRLEDLYKTFKASLGGI